jgi:hypothetical protein
MAFGGVYSTNAHFGGPVIYFKTLVSFLKNTKYPTEVTSLEHKHVVFVKPSCCIYSTARNRACMD